MSEKNAFALGCSVANRDFLKPKSFPNECRTFFPTVDSVILVNDYDGIDLIVFAVFDCHGNLLGIVQSENDEPYKLGSYEGVK